ncbi:hypothetical protein CEF21_04900 [Bacillus sp. FJAT-42376]|uniref:glycoside hydrolase family 38 N-terminal domain-containing protein n=1 Tax=Bacillus sp. FJAT-42376 TaxID=2014076 RepID=UPI000F4FF150|nr:glycoside hydrolase family 38 C-terminal domain-containing protein [Bacillus sp. FJAT-42376]AZB41689.1 hypothetical protein CEF21_04900 [Bacillus sp. FJAT-42376]
MKSVKEVHVLNHTHWDREWYESFEEFRYKLRNGMRYVDELLSSGRIESFFLDGQTIVLDDYQEIVSKEEYARLISWIEEGKIEAGPWYLLADEFLVSGESMLKNLEIGIKKAKELGSSWNIGYLPDTFGHASQMPQIFKGYGIDTAIVWRGAVSDRFENMWEAPDGSEVFTFVLPLFDGYYQTFLKHEDFTDKAKAYLDKNEPFLTYGKALFMNGADHTFTANDLHKRMDRLNEAFPDIHFKQSLMSEYAKAFKGEKPVRKILGEQRDASKIFILPGVYSTRSYLKKHNQMCEDAAVGMMEALNAWTNGRTNSEHFMDYVWKLILQNQPHDSICGCSIDEVHEEMETRTKKVLGAIRQYAKDTLNEEYPFDYLDEKTEKPYLYVVNNTPIKDVYRVRTEIRIPAALDLGAIKLYHHDAEIPFDVIRREVKEEFLRHILAEPHYAQYAVYHVEFMLPFAGVETKRIRIETDTSETAVLEHSESDWIENEFYTVQWNQSGLIITDRETGAVYENQHVFVSSMDAGDTYNYSPPLHDCQSRSILTAVTDIKKGKTSQSAILHYEMELPAALNENRTGPNGETVINKMTTAITLYHKKRLIAFHTTILNQAKDQKLRIGFASGKTDKSFADTAFDLIERKTLREKIWDAPANKEAVMNQYPTYSTVIANEHQLVQRGLQEYEIDQVDGEDYAFLTAIRSVGWLSRRDLRTRGNGAGPGFETPGAQCSGEHEFEYGLTLGKQHQSLNEARWLRHPVLTQQSGSLKDETVLFKQTSPDIVFSSFIQKEKNSFDIRCFNPASETRMTELHFGFDPAAVFEIDFSGEVLMAYEASPVTAVAFKPKQIKTFRIKRREQQSED